MATIPLEIITNGILPRLPAKSLMRFKCVSKPWLALISSHEFIHLHLHYSLSSITNHLLILTENDCSLFSSNLELPECPAIKLPNFGIKPSVVGSCNGLLCIQSHRPYSLFLLNPSTGSYRELSTLLPPRRYAALNFGFGYDSENDDYKVVRIVDRLASRGFLGHQVDRIVQVYSSRANSWEMIEWIPPRDAMGDRENGALLYNNLLHWKFWRPQEGYHIRCFNLCEKRWTSDLPFPDYIKGIRDGILDFGVFDGSLYFSSKNQQEPAVDIWIMKEYGVTESWVKLFQISDSRVVRSSRVSPIAYCRLKNKVLLRTTNKSEHSILWYDIKGEAAECAKINGVADCLWIDVCKGSLVDIPGGSQIRNTKQNDEKEAT